MHPASGTTHQVSLTEAQHLGDTLSIPWDRFDVEQFRVGLNIERERRRRGPASEVTLDESMVAGRIALANLEEIPDYYTQLAVMICSPLRAFHTFGFLLL